MSPKIPRATWVLATHNRGKLAELEALLAADPVDLRSAAEVELEEPDETGLTFEANAEIKAVAATDATGMIALADDSGVSVDALGGEPGIHTADWAGPRRDFALARQRVHDELSKLGPGVSFSATYVCALSLSTPAGLVTTRRGAIRGSLVWPIRGKLGSGFEPMFMPDGYAFTYGEMTPSQRLRINARAQAMRALRDALSADT